MSAIFLDYRMYKPWYASKTIWFNALTILCAVAAFYGWTPDQKLTGTVAGMLVAASPIVNLVLRFMTKKAIVTPAQ
jgi:hypothetical protein